MASIVKAEGNPGGAGRIGPRPTASSWPRAAMIRVDPAAIDPIPGSLRKKSIPKVRGREIPTERDDDEFTFSKNPEIHTF